MDLTVILVEGPNDVMTYNYIIKRRVYGNYLNERGYTLDEEIPCEIKAEGRAFADTYLNFENIAIIPHHGKATVSLLVELCKHLKIEYFVITDWDLDEDFVEKLSKYESETSMKDSELYQESSKKGIITTNWKIIKSVGLDNIHYNIPRLEEVIGYESNDKNSTKIWKALQEIDKFDINIFPDNLRKFITNK